MKTSGLAQSLLKSKGRLQNREKKGDSALEVGRKKKNTFVELWE